MTHEKSNIRYAVELRQVDKIYPGTPPVAALSDVSFSVVHGEFVGIVGASGSGKSTLLHVIGTLTQPTNGDVFIDSINTNGLSDRALSGLRAKSVGFVFQEFFLLPGFSAVQNVANGLLYSGVSSAEREERAKAMLDRVGLAHRMEHRPNEMSGGEQQRVAIARALVHDPAFVLADEPSGNLDSQNTSAVMDLFTKLNQDGTTIILITHDLEVAQISTRQVTLKDGRIEGHPDMLSGVVHE
ncbi:MAG: ABC transporter ATP-binding protein [SAR202 cluster bacterium]|nr:ABC transporter ATP-binding protein [SAR202 cluster bacterium]